MLRNIELIFRKYFPKRLKNYKIHLAAVNNKSGLEIGGPSYAFSSRGFLPLYGYIKDLDGCNFSADTIWEGKITEGRTYQFGEKKGAQIISEGAFLPMISDSQYDFLLSCHSLEHIANPVKALLEWKRIIKIDGYIVLIVPHKDKTFDHKRPLTSLEHLIQDYKNNTQENDATHFEEVINFYDLSMDEMISDRISLEARVKDNFNNRCLHHHVFNTPLLVKLVNYVDLQICDIQHFNPFNIIMLAKKVVGKPNNNYYIDPSKDIYQDHKFPSDKIW
jgi:SAM-dependent methyltransferase